MTDTNDDHADVFTEGGAATAIVSTNIDISDADGATLESATITLTNAQTDDVLNVGALPSGVAASVDTATPGVITVTLTGTASHADYEAAIQAVTFENTGSDPNTTARSFEITVNDGDQNSPVATSTIYVTETGDAPTDIGFDGDSSLAVTVGSGGDGSAQGTGEIVTSSFNGSVDHWEHHT